MPPADKQSAREINARARSRWHWVRINAVRTSDALADLEALAETDDGIRIPKVESCADVEWLIDRLPGRRMICAIESARGVFAAADIAQVPGVERLALGGMDLQRDLRVASDSPTLGAARCQLVLASAAAGIEPPIDSIHQTLDPDSLRAVARESRAFGFAGKSAIHPAQLETIHEVFTVSDEEVAWARRVTEAYDASSGGASTTIDGEFVDKPIAERAAHILKSAAIS